MLRNSFFLYWLSVENQIFRLSFTYLKNGMLWTALKWGLGLHKGAIMDYPVKMSNLRPRPPCFTFFAASSPSPSSLLALA